jgi:cytochrome b561
LTLRQVAAIVAGTTRREAGMATQTIWTSNPRPLSRYTTGAIVLHWAIAAFILFNLATGFFHHSLPRIAILIHISSGVSVLILTVVRIGWRLTHRPPPFASTMPAWERWLAHLVHVLLYLAMIAMPLTGWAMISANPPPGSPGAAAAEAARGAQAPPPGTVPQPVAKRQPPMFWFMIKLPLIKPLQEMGRKPEGLPAQKAKHRQIGELHELGGWILLALLVLHVAGALKHQLIDRQREFARMGIGEPELVP